MDRLLPARLQAALSGEGTPRHPDSPELLGESRRRIRVTALAGTLAYAIFLMVVVADRGVLPDYPIDVRHDLLGIALCGALFAVTWLPFDDRLVVAFAVAFEFALSVVISIHVPWAAWLRTGHVMTLTWVVPIVILFALLVPLSTRIVFTASLACLATAPLALAWLGWRKLAVVPETEILNATLTSVVALGIATLASRTVYGARRQAEAARHVGSYELIERIGHGGMGEVWKARHAMLARPAAVKRILAESLRGSREDRTAAVERFTREARVTASLRSPHTIELYDFGVSADGSLYYAMELLDGMNLEHFVYRFGPVEPRRAVHWLRQACHSLAEAHTRGLVHRDIKPANLFLCRYGRDADFLKVLDFGLTKPLDHPHEESLTEPGVRMGTPSYMAPEQVFGLESGPQTDLYALGCVGYWLLAGRKPFEGTSAAEMMRQHAQAAPPPLQGPAGAAIPPSLERAILRCLAKSPEDRPRDADELGADLAAAVDGAVWRDDEAREWWAKSWPAAETVEARRQPRNVATTMSQ